METKNQNEFTFFFSKTMRGNITNKYHIKFIYTQQLIDFEQKTYKILNVYIFYELDFIYFYYEYTQKILLNSNIHYLIFLHWYYT